MALILNPSSHQCNWDMQLRAYCHPESLGMCSCPESPCRNGPISILSRVPSTASDPIEWLSRLSHAPCLLASLDRTPVARHRTDDCVSVAQLARVGKPTTPHH